MKTLFAVALLSIAAPALADEAGAADRYRDAFGVIAEADAAAERGPSAKDYDSEAEAIGYVRASNAGRVPGDPLDGPGRVVVTGQAEVIEADMIRIGSDVIRLQGVRAPGARDECRTASGAPFDCAAWAATSMAILLAKHPLSCAITATRHEAGGTIGWCDLTVSEGDVRDLGRTAVRSGLLLPSSKAGGSSPYLAQGLEAQQARRGLWSVPFTPYCDGLSSCEAGAKAP